MMLFALAGSAVLVLAGGLLWWLADPSRGVRWAQNVVRDRFPDVPAITGAELQAWLADPHRTAPMLLDARTPEEQAVSMLPGALPVSPEAPAEAALRNVPPDRAVVVYCAAGYRGATLARRLIQAGRKDVHNLDGGIFAWGNEDRPLVKDGQPVEKVHSFSRLFSRMLKRPH